MPEKIEVTPFIRWDIKEVLDNHSETMFDDASEDAEADGAVPSCEWDSVIDKVMEKVTEFVNENYIPKP